MYSEGPHPFNLFGIIYRSPNLNFLNVIKSLLCVPDLFYFNYDTVYQNYDNLTFRKWVMNKNIDEKFYQILLHPTLSITVNQKDIFSAAEILSYLQIYFLTDPRSDFREITKVNYYQAILKPWVDHLQKHNTK